MNRTRQILKKSAAVALGASLILSGSSTAFAAGSYQETEKTALATTGNNVLLMRYYNMDNVSQAIKALSDRDNNKD